MVMGRVILIEAVIIILLGFTAFLLLGIMWILENIYNILKKKDVD